MKPPPFEYHRPSDVDEALALLAEHGEEAKVLAGGQSLVPMMNFRIARPGHLIDISRLRELSYIRAGGGRLRIGAATRQATVERSPLVAAGWPLLTAALECVAHPQIRARGTFGGSLAHADPAAELPVAIAALGATLHVRSVRGRRAVSWRDFFQSALVTSLGDDELLVEVELPAPPRRAGAAFTEYATRHGDFALAGAAALITVDGDGGCTELALSLLAAGPAPVLSDTAAQAARGRALHDVAVREIAHEALADAEILDVASVPADYRRRVLTGLAAQAITDAAARARSLTGAGA